MYQTGIRKQGRDKPATTLQWGVSGLFDMEGVADEVIRVSGLRHSAASHPLI